MLGTSAPINKFMKNILKIPEMIGKSIVNYLKYIFTYKKSALKPDLKREFKCYLLNPHLIHSSNVTIRYCYYCWTTT